MLILVPYGQFLPTGVMVSPSLELEIAAFFQGHILLARTSESPCTKFYGASALGRNAINFSFVLNHVTNPPAPHNWVYTLCTMSLSNSKTSRGFLRTISGRKLYSKRANLCMGSVRWGPEEVEEFRCQGVEENLYLLQGCLQWDVSLTCTADPTPSNNIIMSTWLGLHPF